MINNGISSPIKPVKKSAPQPRLLFSEDELEQSKIANRLIDAIERRIVTTPGQLNGWCNTLWFLPSDWKDHVWVTLSRHIDHAEYKDLYILYSSNVARYKSDMERRKSRKRRSEGAGE